MPVQDSPVLVAGARTPVGRFRGALAEVSAVDLGAHAVRAALAKAPSLEPDYTVMGNVLQAMGGQNPARQAAVRGGVATTVPGLTLNDVCLAGMTAVSLAARMVEAGEARSVLVGGLESMTRAPGDVMRVDGLWCALDDVGMGELSDRANAELGIGRDEQDAFAIASHRRAARATDEGRLSGEIVPVPVNGGSVAVDEGIRRDTSRERLAALTPAFVEGGTITAGNASQLSDAGAAGLVSTLRRARAAGVEPLAEVAGSAVVAGPDQTLHLKPAAAARKLLEAHGLVPGDVDLWEINEAFAGVVVASMRELGIDHERVNVNGGAVALGHPLGASGFRLVLTLAHELRRRGAELGVAAICGGGGQGAALLLRAPR